MRSKPIGPTAHGAIDYAFATLNTLAPTLFGLTGPARAICYGFAASQGLLNALTDHPLGVKKVVPLRVHGELETPYVPAILLLPWVTGALQQRNARLYFLSFFAIASANYLLTDYNAYEPAAPPPAGQRALELVESAIA
ncbi:MAG TPA: hypothetical protein VF590_10590 [Isosphaeraceae bacterium]|jgi:hypothetical protein